MTSILGPKGDPCSKLSCPRYAHCKATFDGNSASCHCPDICAENSLSEDTMVCGKYFKNDIFLCWNKNTTNEINNDKPV